jgi:hypothetical protein
MSAKASVGTTQGAETKFVPGQDKKELRSASDIVTSHKDFVVEYQSMKVFSQNYSLSSTVLGSGAFG